MQEQQVTNKYKTQTFAVGNKLYLYHVTSQGPNSTIKIFNSEGKLRSSQRVQLPAKCSIHTSQHYLIAETGENLTIYQVPISIPTVINKPFSSEIKLLTYNGALNLIFLLTKMNELFYILPEIGMYTIKFLLKCVDHEIFGFIREMAIDDKGVVNLYEEGKDILHRLTFNWQGKKQKLMRKEIVQEIISIYCSPTSKNSITIKKQINTPRHHQLQIKTSKQQYTSSVPIFKPENLPIIKSTSSDILYLDLQSKSIVLIHQNQQMTSYEMDIKLPVRGMDSNLVVFNVKKIRYNMFNLDLCFYSVRDQQFQIFSIPLKSIQGQDQDISNLVYIHNNIHLILTENGLQTHFNFKIFDFLGESFKKDKFDTEAITQELLKKLFIQNPSTVMKLANAFRNNCRSKSTTSFLNIYSKPIKFILEQVINNFKEIESNGLQNQQTFQEYRKNRTLLENIIRFTSIILNVIKQVKLNYFEDNQNQMSPEEQTPIQRYCTLVQRSKSLYLLNEIFYHNRRNLLENRRDSRNSSDFLPKSQVQQNETKGNQKDEQKKKTKKKKNNNQDEIFNSCHQNFDYILAEEQMLKFQQIVENLKECTNFLYAAYFYTYYFIILEKNSGDGLEIPYISDNETVQLLKFLVMYTKNSLKDRERLKYVYRNLPSKAGRALLLNQPSFLKHLCTLSIASNQKTSCLSILLSKAIKCEDTNSLKFVLNCLIVCGRTNLAFLELQNYLLKFKKQKPEKIPKYQSIFVGLCIKNHKVKDLLMLSNEYQFNVDVKKQLSEHFGTKEIQEITVLIKHLSGH